MLPRWTHPISPGRRFFAFFFSAGSPLRYGVAAIIVLSLVFFSGYVVPAVYRDIALLHSVYSVDEEGIRLAGELQSQIQESRRAFLRVLLAGSDPAEAGQERQAMRAYDAQVAATEGRLAQLNALPAGSVEQLQERWSNYVTQRDGMLAAGTHPDAALARRRDSDLGKSAFAPVDRSVREAQAIFAAASARHIGQLSAELTGSLRELFVLLLIKIVLLILLVWSDWKRLRAESQLQRTARELSMSEDRFRKAYEGAVVGMGIFKIDGTVLSVNARGAQMLGYEPEELIGKKVSTVMAPEHVEDHLNRLAATPLTDENSYHAERRVIRKDGSEAWVRNSVMLLRPEGEEPYYFSMSEEITQQRKASERLAFLANYDPVTNLPNRRCFEEQLALRLENGSEGVALLYLEIDSFDFLKGTFGRGVAEDVLSELGNCFASFHHAGELVGRIDDHGFGMAIPAASGDETAMKRANELRERIQLSGTSGKHRIPISASIGIAYANDGCPGASRLAVEPLLKYARAAMLEARSRGGDSIIEADPSLQERAAQRHQIELALLRGLRENEFRVVFQPQFEIATGKLMRFEALCRWHSAELGTIPPDRFIPIAEQTGLIMEIGRRILHEALHEARSWIDSGRRIGLAVNISPMQFMRPDFIDVITEALASSQFSPALLELEITEGIFIRDLNLAVARIRELQKLGLSIALDDFGTGYSSLSYLQRMPIDAVKLDRSFVNDLTTDAATVSMVRSVLSMASALHLRVVTEGVETEQQLEILRSLGCDEAQGYLLGRPESAELAYMRVVASPAGIAGSRA